MSVPSDISLFEDVFKNLKIYLNSMNKLCIAPVTFLLVSSMSKLKTLSTLGVAGEIPQHVDLDLHSSFRAGSTINTLGADSPELKDALHQVKLII